MEKMNLKIIKKGRLLRIFKRLSSRL